MGEEWKEDEKGVPYTSPLPRPNEGKVRTCTFGWGSLEAREVGEDRPKSACRWPVPSQLAATSLHRASQPDPATPALLALLSLQPLLPSGTRRTVRSNGQAPGNVGDPHPLATVHCPLGCRETEVWRGKVRSQRQPQRHDPHPRPLVGGRPAPAASRQLKSAVVPAWGAVHT